MVVLGNIYVYIIPLLPSEVTDFFSPTYEVVPLHEDQVYFWKAQKMRIMKWILKGKNNATENLLHFYCLQT